MIGFAQLGVTGALPVAAPLAVVVAARLGALLFSRERAVLRALGGALAAAALFVLGVRLLGALGALRPAPLLAALVLLTIVLVATRRDLTLVLPWRRSLTWLTSPVLVVMVAGVALAALAARWLPVWQWDSLGYHLPYVNFALQRGHLADVPQDVPYLSTYPHDVELLFVAFRAMLPDDRLVELAHLPLGLLGSLAIASLARLSGARPDDALCAGAAWLTLPAVFLQLPTNYVDVASAAFLLGGAVFLLAPMTRSTVLGCALGLGLYLGTKPNAPVATALLLAVLLVRAWQRSLLLPALAAAALVLLLGGETYVVNTLRHGSPAWPVRVDIGPLHLPGNITMATILGSGAALPRAHGPLPWRVLSSWASLSGPPGFDMRLGGFGPLFLAALPVAIVTAVRRRATVFAVLAVASLASPDPSVARYVLAFAGLTLALAASALAGVSTRVRGGVHALAGAGAVWNLVYAAPGLTGEGPPLLDYAAMSDPERQRAVGADGRPIAIRDAVEHMAQQHPGSVTAFDVGLDLPYLAWPPDLSTGAVRIEDAATEAEVERVITGAGAHLLIAAPDGAAGRLAGGAPLRFQPLFPCRSAQCLVFAVP